MVIRASGYRVLSYVREIVAELAILAALALLLDRSAGPLPRPLVDASAAL
jgi:hypothetical protein